MGKKELKAERQYLIAWIDLYLEWLRAQSDAPLETRWPEGAEL
jgi:hypothetical protein